MDNAILEQLIVELLMTKGMLVVVDSGGAVAEMHPSLNEPHFEDGWAMVEAKDWHAHLNMATIDGAQFVEAKDNYHDFPKLFYARLSNAEGGTIIRFYFPNPWLDEDENRTDFQPEKLRAFEEFRDRYVGRGGIVFVQR